MQAKGAAALPHSFNITWDIAREQGAAAIPNLSGDWTDTDGVRHKLEHRGENVVVYVLDSSGRAVGEGHGTIAGNQIRFSIRRPDYGNGTGNATVRPDGRQISGDVQYDAQRFGFSIFKND